MNTEGGTSGAGRASIKRRGCTMIIAKQKGVRYIMMLGTQYSKDASANCMNQRSTRMAEKEYIERDFIVDSIRKSFDFYYQIPIYPSDREVQNIVNRVKRIVQELPAADVAPVVHGEWVVEEERTGNYSHCSQCGIRCRGYAPNYKYCPNCGAKMDGGKHG
jgi:hypothetical protein